MKMRKAWIVSGVVIAGLMMVAAWVSLCRDCLELADKGDVNGRIELVAFTKSGGIAGVQEGWVIRDGKSPVPGPARGIDDRQVTVIKWAKIRGLVGTIKKLDQSGQGRAKVADAFEFEFVVGFEDGKAIKAWRQDVGGSDDDLKRFVETAAKVREVVMEGE